MGETEMGAGSLSRECRTKQTTVHSVSLEGVRFGRRSFEEKNLKVVSKLSREGGRESLTRTRKFVDSTTYSNDVRTDIFDSTSLSKRDRNCLHQQKMIA